MSDRPDNSQSASEDGSRHVDLVVITGYSGAGKSEAIAAFEDGGYFCVDSDSTDGALVFNRTIPLKDSWAKAAQKK